VGVALDKIIADLKELGMTERKIINALKRIKEDMTATDKVETSPMSKEFNVRINEMLFSNGAFGINTPSKQLLGLRKILTDRYGSVYVYFALSRIVADRYFYKEYYDKNDEEKSNLLMYRLRENNVRLRDEFEMINTVRAKEPSIDLQYLNIEEEEELNDSDKDLVPTYHAEGDVEWI
jgi:hypothetical protein